MKLQIKIESNDYIIKTGVNIFSKIYNYIGREIPFPEIPGIDQNTYCTGSFLVYIYDHIDVFKILKNINTEMVSIKNNILLINNIQYSYDFSSEIIDDLNRYCIKNDIYCIVYSNENYGHKYIECNTMMYRLEELIYKSDDIEMLEYSEKVQKFISDIDKCTKNDKEGIYKNINYISWRIGLRYINKYICENKINQKTMCILDMIFCTTFINLESYKDYSEIDVSNFIRIKKFLSVTDISHSTIDNMSSILELVDFLLMVYSKKIIIDSEIIKNKIEKLLTLIFGEGFEGNKYIPLTSNIKEKNICRIPSVSPNSLRERLYKNLNISEKEISFSDMFYNLNWKEDVISIQIEFLNNRTAFMKGDRYIVTDVSDTFIHCKISRDNCINNNDIVVYDGQYFIHCETPKYGDICWCIDHKSYYYFDGENWKNHPSSDINIGKGININ